MTLIYAVHSPFKVVPSYNRINRQSTHHHHHKMDNQNDTPETAPRSQRTQRTEMPSISSHRRPLTPSFPVPSATATATSTLFQRIPPEIRRMILIHAFGDQTMHLDLYKAYPYHDTRASSCPEPTHANRNPRVRNAFGAAPMRWEWAGSVCHRSPMRSDAPVLGSHAVAPGPWDDECNDIHATKQLCHCWPGSVPEKCFVGALGWLRACRQAYSEGVEVLYGTNVFHFRGTDFVQRLPRVLVRERLDAIRGVELAWDVCPWTGLPEEYAHWEEWRPVADMERFCGALDVMPETLPNVRFMYLSLQGYFLVPEGVEYGGEEHWRMTEDALVRVDGMVLKMRNLVDCRVAVSKSVFWTRIRRAVEQDEETYSHRGMWRGLLPKEAADQRIEGYWVCEGVDDSE